MKQLRVILASLFVTLVYSVSVANELPFCTEQTAPLALYDIQGDGYLSPVSGETVETYGVVTATFYERNQIGGFFVQDPLGDDNDATSDAIFVRKRSGDLPAVGDFVQFTGRIVETDHLTSATAVQDLVVCGQMPVPEPVVLSLPVADALTLEAAEGMLVTFQQPLIVTESYDLGRYGQLVLADERLFTAEQFADEPSVPNALRRIVLDDTFTTENISPTPYLNAAGLPPRAGDTVTHVVGILASESGDVYRIEPTEPVEFARTNPRPAAPNVQGDAPGDEVLTIAGFNAYNFFVSVDGRGASSPRELERQTAKLVAAITGLDADIVGLMEIENDGGRSIERLVEAVNDALGHEEYTAVHTGVLGTDAITQAVMYRPDIVTPRLVHAAHDASIHNRPPVGVVFERVDGQRIVVVVGHFKSKGSCPATGDTDRGFGCWNLRRNAQANATSDFAQDLARVAQTEYAVIIGDLNSYGNEPPMQTFMQNGWVDLGTAWLDPEERYSYVFKGEFGTLDYALVTPELADRVTGFAYWHINADEPRAFDYSTTWNLPASFQPDEFRSSDHDPSVFGVQLPWLD